MHDAEDVAHAWRVLETVMDPELPVLSVVDLGIVRFVERTEGALRIGVAPTYSGCPALRFIRERIRDALREAGAPRVEVQDVLSPAWTTEWISERGRRVLRECGIAPPRRGTVHCPRCESERTERVSEFGSTPCKGQYRCLECLEPFEYFKCI